jgi:hypothetical protein
VNTAQYNVLEEKGKQKAEKAGREHFLAIDMPGKHTGLSGVCEPPEKYEDGSGGLSERYAMSTALDNGYDSAYEKQVFHIFFTFFVNFSR